VRGLARRPGHGIRAAATAATAALLPLAALAQWSGSLTIASDYRFRGVTLSGSKAAARLDANFDSSSGWYAGGAAIGAPAANSDRYGQLFGYGGYAMPLGSGRSLDFGANFSHFSGRSGYDFAEAYAGLLAQRWSLRLNYSPDYFGRHLRTAYFDASAHWPVSDRARLFGHAGWLAPLGGGYPGDTDAQQARADLLLGAGWTMGDADLRLAWTTVSPGGPPPAPDPQRSRGAWLLSLSYSF
jgi:uncharacterized protein (TIGR02001 family)